MATKLQICNMALTLLKTDTISSLDEEDSKNAFYCNLFFDQVSAEVMSVGAWNSVLTRTKLNQSGTPLFGFSYQYALPVDCLSVISIHEYSGKWQREGNLLLMNNDVCYVRYAKNLDLTADYDVLLTSAVVDYLVVKLSYVISASETVVQMAQKDYKEKIQLGLAQNSVQGSIVTLQDNVITPSYA